MPAVQQTNVGPVCQSPPDGSWETALEAIAPGLGLLLDQIVQVAPLNDSGHDYCSGQVDLDVPYRDMSQHATEVCRICLGELYDVGWLEAGVIPGFVPVPSETFSDLIAELMPEFWASLEAAQSAGVTPASIAVTFAVPAEQEPGLFWTAEYLRMALKWAAVWVWADAPLAALPYPAGVPNPANVSTAAFRSAVEQLEFTVLSADGVPGAQDNICGAYDVRIAIDALGNYAVRADPDPLNTGSGWGMQNPGGPGPVNVCPVNHQFAARVDYLLWWAARLKLWSQVTGSRWHALMAVMAARAAVANLAEIAFTIVHELVHDIAGTGGHCTTSNAGNGSPLDCAMSKAAMAFRQACVAKYGLPNQRNTQSEAEFHERNPTLVRETCPITQLNALSVGVGIRINTEHFELIRLNHCMEQRYTFLDVSCDAGGLTFITSGCGWQFPEIPLGEPIPMDWPAPMPFCPPGDPKPWWGPLFEWGAGFPNPEGVTDFPPLYKQGVFPNDEGGPWR